MEGLHAEQANVDFFVLAETIKDYVGLLGAVKEVFHERTKVFQNWQHSQQMLSRRRESRTKLELLGRSEKLDQASAEVLDVSRMLTLHLTLIRSTRYGINFYFFEIFSGSLKSKEANKSLIIYQK